MVRQLKKVLGTRAFIQVERAYPSNPRLNGYLVGLSRTLAVMHCFDDFEPDGYSLFFTDAITGVRSGKHERHWDRMLSGEGLLGGLDQPLQIDLASLRNAIGSVQAQFGKMIIECEDRDADIEDFYIGRISDMTSTAVLFDHFDAVGEWSRVPATIPVEEMTLVQFDTPYLNRFWNYV